MGQASREIPLGRPGHRFDYCDSGQKQDRTDSCVPGKQIAGSMKKTENFLNSWGTISLSQDGLCSL